MTKYSIDVVITITLTQNGWQNDTLYFQVVDAINDISFEGGSTNTYSGLRQARKQQFSRDQERESGDDEPEVPKVLIYITDGRSTSGRGKISCNWFYEYLESLWVLLTRSIRLTLYVAVTQFTYGKLRYFYVKS